VPSAAPAAALIDPGVIAEMQAAVGQARMPHLLAVFAEETEARLSQLERAVTAGERASVAHLAHALRSAAGTFGASALSHAARRLEEVATGDGSEDIAASFAPMPALTRDSIAALAALAAGG
jgi:HPt (histidine-containing phosphotransfer) domain-containing protein